MGIEYDGPTKDRDVEIVQSHVSQLAEHFEAVQIFVTKTNPDEPGSTITVQLGTGNWFARYGHVKAWMIKEDAVLREEATRDD